MSAETQKVDVLAVMDSLVGVAEGMAFRLDSNQPAHDWAEKVRATRAAVAELIEACRRATCQCPRGAWKTDEHPLGVHRHDCHLGNIPAALARVGGAA